MGSSRFFVGLSFSCACIVVGCGNLIGLGGYSVAGGGAGVTEGGTGNEGGRAQAGGAGVETAEGGMSGGADESGGASGASGADGGSAGAGGSPDTCPDGCDDLNDCTTDSCTSGECTHAPVALGSACGVSRSCDELATCVRCRNTASGSGQDVGCSPAAPICLGTGLDAVCTGCTSPADCNDGNECTTEACADGKCVFTPVAAGSLCSTGVCNGAASAEKCVACANTAAGAAQDSGCTAAKPVCDASSTPTCFECLSNADCAASGDVCKPKRCDAAFSCKSVDISASKVVIGIPSGQGNGGFESVTGDAANGWADIGTFTMIYNCNASGSGCLGSNGTTYTQATAGSYLAWLGGTSSASITGLEQLIVLPAGTVKLQVMADTNFQTKSAASGNKDSFEVRLLDAAKGMVGAPLFASSNVNAQTGAAHAWTVNGINVTADVSAYTGAHPGEDSYLSLWSSVDAALTTDFFVDNVRVMATVCQ